MRFVPVFLSIFLSKIFKSLVNKKEVVYWSLYDFANQPFTTLIVTFIFGKFFVEGLAPDTISGTSLWSKGIAVTAILVSLLSPVLGALADSGGYRKKLLMLSTYTCVVFTFLLYFFEPGKIFVFGEIKIEGYLLALIVFVIANIGFEFGTVFCNSYLSDLSDNNNIGKISGYAWGLGFVGGLISLALSLGLFEVQDTNQVRNINILVSIWFLVFSVPTLFLLKDVKSKKGFSTHLEKSIKSIYYTFRNISKHKNIVRFLIARLFYNDALVTIFAFGGIYAGYIGFDYMEVLILGIVLNISACIGSFCLGYFEDKIGVVRMLNFTLWMLLFSVFLAFIAPFVVLDKINFIIFNKDIFEIINPKNLFWISGILLGFMQGPNQSGSRSLMARLTPDNKKNEFFGFYAFSGKATSFVGPVLFGLTTSYFGTQQAGLVVVCLFFLIGIILFNSVKFKS
tara:strand:+ start:282 stop:1640 length:1359 start_codon:yes stop_codon:yes gene_type:complete